MKRLALVVCEESGTFSGAMRAAGHECYSCDLLPTSSDEAAPFHFVGDALEIIKLKPWTTLIGFPPCTFLAKAMLWDKSPERLEGREKAVKFFKDLMDSGIDEISLENPAGHLTKAYRPANQIVYPWWFGDPYRKEVHLWTRNLPPLMATYYCPVRKPIHNHVNGRMTQAEKSVIKSSWKYYPKMVEAIVNQWFRT